MKNELLTRLLTDGNATQRYILRRDVCGEPVDSPGMTALQEEILRLKQVRRILDRQNADGWIGTELHGGVGTAIDASAARLRELGVDPRQPFMRRAKEALLADRNPDTADRRHRYPPVEQYHFSRALTLAHLQVPGEPTEPLLARFQQELLAKFERARQVTSLDEVSRVIRAKRFQGSRAYLPGKDFPWPCDFLVLGASSGWRTPAAQQSVTDALENVARLAPIPPIFDIVDGHYVAPICNYAAFDGADDPCLLPKTELYWWLPWYRRLCAICHIEQLPYYVRQAQRLAQHVADGDLLTAIHPALWPALEKAFNFDDRPWQTDAQRERGILFPALLILHEAGL